MGQSSPPTSTNQPKLEPYWSCRIRLPETGIRELIPDCFMRCSSEISLTSKLDYETQRSHSLTVRCIDNAGEEPFNEVFASVTVLVRDVNDNSPVIHNSDLSRLSVSEDTPVNTTITVLSVSDADEGGKQSVHLDANHTIFRVTDEHYLIVAEKVDNYAGERLCSNITATDSGSPPLSVSYPYCVTVYPASNNHNSPLIVFPKDNSIYYFDENAEYDELLRVKILEEGNTDEVSYRFDQTFKKDIHFSVMENNRSSPPRQIGRIPAALDADFHGDNTKICYTTDSVLFFFLDQTLPVLYTNQSFDREQKEEIRFRGQASPGSHLANVYATDPDEEKAGLRYAISGAVRTPKQSYALSDAPIKINAKTGELTASDSLHEASYSFTVTVTDGVGHVDSANVIISVVAYSQQFELLFDAPYDFIKRNQKNIVRKLMSSNTTSRRELRNAYGLRDVEPVNISGSKALEAIIFGVMVAVLVLLILCLCLYCRQRHSYARKLQHITAQAAAHHASLSRQPTQKINPYYTTATTATAIRTVAPPPPPPLQSTEL
ncbi:cadherin domain protein [Teladorsagia circumcincta]|uniref:Cadherin domain protein n=1 Tax=Teladorsagia circumcincta TaxID=45464 RepID=A0A2G9U1F5_TELCI|nr:cadherin domain protein [Teladorsagia circumcincta]